MTGKHQQGYTDMQFAPVILGVVLLVIVIGLVDNPEFNVSGSQVRFYSFLLLACAVLLYGFAMHLYALGYPESPFNKHTSPVLMTLLCTGPLAYGAYRLHSVDAYPGFLIFLLLSLLVPVLSIVFALLRNRHGEHPADEAGSPEDDTL